LPEPDAIVCVVDDDVSVREALEGLIPSAAGIFPKGLCPAGATRPQKANPGFREFREFATRLPRRDARSLVF
jgi:hypothetical protein